MSFEDEFAQALRGAVALAPEPGLHTLAAAAQRRGRRRRNQRRALAVSGLAAVLVVAVSLTAVVGGGSHAARPATEPVRPMTAEESVGLFTSLLPPGKSRVLFAATPAEAGPNGDRYQTGGTVLFDDGKGESMISYTVSRTELTPEAGAVCMDGFSEPQEACERAVDTDGSALVVDKLKDRNSDSHREWRATWAAPDGRRVTIIEHNGQPATPNRENPPLDAEQLRALVTAPAWARLFDALPARDIAPRPPTPEPGPKAEDLLAALVPLLPPGAVPSGQDGRNGPHLTVTYEGRTSMLSVSVTEPGERGVKDKEYAEAEGSAGPLAVRERRPDGSTVVTNMFGNGKTAVDPVLHWAAAVHYADGRAIEINEWNGENGYTFRPGNPALGVDQLKAIVTAPVWLR
ncbi:hypothetical protein ABT263_23180 [Kitasatospora sp. NPDC001603]|uniref:hypothetical protein n=1 Tax=Kitasatospora sp. NPDC001603 TaxID=3154388 RepID=UPI003329537F